MKINLTETQKFYLEQQHRVEPNSDISDRIKAILLANKGWTQKHIAEALLIHETTVWGHVNDYLRTQKLNNNSGVKAIEAANPLATKIHIIADGGKAHTANEVKLFLAESNAVNRLYLEETHGINLPSNSVKLSQKMIIQLNEVLSKEPVLFKDSSILGANKLTAKGLLLALRDISPHPKLIMHLLPPYSPNLNPIERV